MTDTDALYKQGLVTAFAMRQLGEAADGRPLTGSQQRDLDRFHSQVADVIRGIGSSDLADKYLSAGTDADPIELARVAANHIDLAHRMAAAESVRGRIEAFTNHRPEGPPSMDTSTDSLRSLWSTWRSNGFAATDSYLSPTFETEIRALGSSGGSAIPTTFADFVVRYERTANPMLDPNVVRIIPSRSGAPLTIPRLTADVAHGGTVTAEAAAINELDPTISSVELGAYKYAVINLFSAELDQDDAINLDDLLADSTGRELGLDIGVHLTTGDGTNKPRGFLTDASNGGTASGTANGPFFGWTDLVALWGSVAAPYRMNGTFMVSTDAFTKILALEDANGNPVMNINNGRPTLLGRPIVENPAMAAVASASKSVAFGDFSRYIVKRVTPTRVELSRDYKFSTDQVALKVVERVDAALIDTAAVAYLVSGNT